MSNGNQDAFHERLKRLQKSQGKAARRHGASGASRRGSAEPKRRVFRLAWKAMALVVLGFFVLKAVIMLNMGTSAYLEKWSALEEGAIAQKIGFYIMAPEPVSMQIRDWMDYVMTGLRT